MMLFVRAERESDWPLHLVAVKRMLPYFFASGHVNYARYGLYYLRSMESLQGEQLSMFMRGERVMHHVPGLWNGIWSDMYIETTFMQYGHGPGGIIGITLKPETLKTWALGLHVCCQLEQDTVNLSCNEQDKCQLNYKEEAKSKIKSDRADRENLSKKLELCIYPLNHVSHPPSILNIVSGRHRKCARRSSKNSRMVGQNSSTKLFQSRSQLYQIARSTLKLALRRSLIQQ